MWCCAGRNYAALQRFFAELGDRRKTIKAVSIDMLGDYEKAIREVIPDAEIAFVIASSGSARARSSQSSLPPANP